MLRKCKLALVCQNKSNLYEIFQLKNEILTFASASLSVIISAASYLMEKFSQLPLPSDPLKQYTAFSDKVVKTYHTPLCHSFHPLFDQWIQLLINAFFEQNAFRVSETLYLKVNIPQELGQTFKKYQVPFIQCEHSLSLFQIFNIQGRHLQKKVAWINCSTSQIQRLNYQTEANSIALLLGQIYNNEKYDIYNILQGQIPTVQQLLGYDLLLIPGSGLSVLIDHQNILKLSEIVLQSYKKSNKLKILGICYGHQLVAKMFGAQVEKKERVRGVQLINFNKQVVNNFGFLQPLKLYQQNICISQFHQDFVTSIPEQYIKLGNSQSSEYQSFVSKNGKIFTTQFHPEYIFDFKQDYISKLETYYLPQNNQSQKYLDINSIIQQHLKGIQCMRECFQRFISQE